MNKLAKWFKVRLATIWTRSHLAWLILTLALIGPYFLARRVEPHSWLVFRQLVALYVIDSLLFFNVGRSHAKIGLLTLIFLITMEIFTTTFYVLAIYSGATY